MLNREVESKIREYGASLEQNAKKVYGKHLKTSGVGNIVSFYIDDGHTNDWDIIKPISEIKGVPFTIACIPNAIDYWGDYAMTVTQLTTLQNMGWEINSHTYNHLDLSKLTEAEIEVQLKKSKEYFEQRGLKCNSICYPYGYLNETVMKVARKYYRSGLGSDHKANKPPINSYNMYRFNFDNDNLDGLKAKIDALDNEWAIIYLHSENWTPDGDGGVKQQANTEKLNGIIDYVKTKQIPTLTVDQALDVFENKLDIGDDSTNGFRIGADGSIKNRSIATIYKSNSGTNNTTHISKFEKGKITVESFIIADNVGMTFVPNLQDAGTLMTYRLHTDDALSFQVFHYVDNLYILKRTWNITTNSWNPWKIISSTSIKREIYIDPVAPSSSRIYDYTIAGLRLDGALSVTFETELPTGLICQASVPEVGKIRLKIYNVTSASISVGVKNIFVTQH